MIIPNTKNSQKFIIFMEGEGDWVLEGGGLGIGLVSEGVGTGYWAFDFRRYWVLGPIPNTGGLQEP